MRIKAFNYEKGRIGEEMAMEYLRRRGYKVVEKNWRFSTGEIDIVCDFKGTLVFVEVKLKVGEMLGEPEEMIGRGKILKILRLGEIYLQRRGVVDKKCRVDAVCIVLNKEMKIERIRHYQNLTGGL